MRVSVEYVDGEPYGPLNLNQEQWSIITGPTLVAAARMGTAVANFIATPPDRGWQRNEGLLLLHSFLSLDILVAFSAVDKIIKQAKSPGRTRGA